MKTRINSLLWSSLLCPLCFFAANASVAYSAPPSITYLYLAGAQRGTSVEVTATGALDAGAKVWASGTGVAVENAKGKLKVTVAKDAVPGVYWLRAHNTEGASGLRPFVVGTLPEVTEKEPNDDIKKPHQLDGSSYVVNGKLEKNGDVDCFAVSLKKGQTLVASLEAHHTLRSPMDAMLQIVSADGFVLDENNDFRGLDPQVAYTAKKDGVYIARIYAFPAQPDASVRHFGSDACVYRLTLTTGAFADYPLPLAVGPNSAALELRGWNLSDLPKLLPVPPRTDGDTHMTFFDPRVSNPLRLRVEPHHAGRWSDLKPGDGGLAQLVKPPASVSTVIEKSKGQSEITVLAKKGQPLTLQVESRSLGLAVNPVVRILGSDRKQLARAEPAKLGGDTALSFDPPADGGYLVEVSDLYGGGGERHAFLIRVLTELDYELTVAADRFTAEPGKPAVVAVTVNRLRGFAKAVEVTAVGLPDGAKVEVVQPAKPNPNAVTLHITSDRPVSGAFRLVGTVKDEPKLTRVARAPLAEFDTTTADLWFTATAAKK